MQECNFIFKRYFLAKKNGGNKRKVKAKPTMKIVIIMKEKLKFKKEIEKERK